MTQDSKAMEAARRIVEGESANPPGVTGADIQVVAEAKGVSDHEIEEQINALVIEDYAELDGDIALAAFRELLGRRRPVSPPAVEESELLLALKHLTKAADNVSRQGGRSFLMSCAEYAHEVIAKAEKGEPS